MAKTQKKRFKKNSKKSKKSKKIKKKGRSKKKTKKVYTKKDFKSGDGMLTTVWGPSLWHTLHTISFNYPVKPTEKDKKNYRRFIMNLKFVLPCKYCRMNFKKNLKDLPLTDKALKNRNNFSRWMYKMHEHINKMLGKKSGLKYCDVRERYEHFRSRCTEDKDTVKIIQIIPKNKTRKKEKGCVEPLFGKKSKCIIKIVPKEEKTPTFQMDKKCIKKRK
tara:strand:+ start:280 stop:933 length:654 start_codon:yes stop_codon:yes gene_type:complete